jgi:hypothetical protein
MKIGENLFSVELQQIFFTSCVLLNYAAISNRSNTVRFTFASV